ncbi:MAG: HNH endonuclease [Solirubrobacteraceae bacterium]
MRGPGGRGRRGAHTIRNGSTRQWRSTRAAILARDHWQCRICGHPAEHVDHILPLAHGGTDTPSNLRATCGGCNLSRRT